ncbi:corticotropin-releasing factor-binding protein-like [Dermatophagoides farinae]|nr:uncharacterized protein LOC124493589 [Dermatophagoides farinae]
MNESIKIRFISLSTSILSILLILCDYENQILATDIVFKDKINLPKPNWPTQRLKSESVIYITKPGRYALYIDDEKLLKTKGRILFATSRLNASIGIFLNERNSSCITSENYFINYYDGWKFPNGRRFPSPGQHAVPFKKRICESNQTYEMELNRIFISSQNFAMITYRIPVINTGFTFTFMHRDISLPCNVMFYEENYNKYGAGGREPFVRDTYALRNFHREINCSAYIFQQRKHKFAPFLRIGGMEIGKTDYSFSAPTPKRNNESCKELGLKDYAEIGGDSSVEIGTKEFEVGFDVCDHHSAPTNVMWPESPDYRAFDFLINCRIITIRLVSSGRFANIIKFKYLPPRMQYVCDWQYKFDTSLFRLITVKSIFTNLYC